MISKFLLLTSVLCLSVSFAIAQDEDGKGGRRAQAIKKFDTDGDGKLSETERKAARASMQKSMKARVLAKYDTDKDGKLSDEEKAEVKKAMQERKANAIAKYDTDGDGELSDEEKTAARKAVMKERSAKKSEE